jgi:hypothetical protein
MRGRVGLSLMCGAVSLLSLANVVFAAVPTIVPWAQRNTVDTDGDSTPDLVDNAPGIANNQQDTDADQIGDIIDPTPNNSNPALGDPGLGMLGPYTITTGSHAFLDYLMVLGTPPGAWGYIDLDFGGNGIYDATYFGPLTANFNQIDIPPNLYVDGTWNLNAVGSYQVFAKAFGPGMHSQNDTITGVNVVPEPGAIALLSVGCALLVMWRRSRR